MGWLALTQRWVLAGLLVGGCLLAPPAGAEQWTRRYINSLPDSAFAAIEVAPDGKKVRHLPHHNRAGEVDLAHVRNALSRWSQVQWLDPAHAAAAREHLLHHLRTRPPTQ